MDRSFPASADQKPDTTNLDAQRITPSEADASSL